MFYFDYIISEEWYVFKGLLFALLKTSLNTIYLYTFEEHVIYYCLNTMLFLCSNIKLHYQLIIINN